jgi:hypothetical protein
MDEKKVLDAIIAIGNAAGFVLMQNLTVADIRVTSKINELGRDLTKAIEDLQVERQLLEEAKPN